MRITLEVKPNTIFSRYKNRNNFNLMQSKKILKYVCSKFNILGYKLAYTSLLLFYAYQNPQTPRWAKNIVLGALGYLLNPFDAILDITPIVGYTDDIGVLSFALVTIGAYIDQDIKIKARQKLKDWSGKIDLDSIQSVEKVL